MESKETKTVWLFNGPINLLSGGIFEELEDAEKWVDDNSLTGMLTEYPVNIGVFDWAMQKGLIAMTEEELIERRKEPNFIGSFTIASMYHYHYKDGKRE
jgi:hypothetical protein